MARGLARGALFCLAACGALACGGAPPRPTTPLPTPDGRTVRNAAIDAFGRRAWEALADGAPERVLYDQVDLRVLLAPAAATRLSARRLSLSRRIGSHDDSRSLLDGTRYAGICLQGAREVEAGGVLGLRSPGWVFDRALLIGVLPSGRRLASWFEGIFVFTDAGFGALDLERVEVPRWEHSDLEIAPCDFAVREDPPDFTR